MQTNFKRSESDKMIGGVCGGLAAYLGVDSVLVRFAFIMLIFASGIGLPLYVILLIIMPSDMDDDLLPNRDADWYLQDEITITDEDIENIKEENRQVARETHPQGPVIFAVILILVGVYLLGQNMGFLGFLNIGWFGPLLIMGIGLFVIFRRRSTNQDQQ